MTVVMAPALGLAHTGKVEGRRDSPPASKETR